MRYDLTGRIASVSGVGYRVWYGTDEKYEFFKTKKDAERAKDFIDNLLEKEPNISRISLKYELRANSILYHKMPEKQWNKQVRDWDYIEEVLHGESHE